MAKPKSGQIRWFENEGLEPPDTEPLARRWKHYILGGKGVVGAEGEFERRKNQYRDHRKEIWGKEARSTQHDHKVLIVSTVYGPELVGPKDRRRIRKDGVAWDGFIAQVRSLKEGAGKRSGQAPLCDLLVTKS